MPPRICFNWNAEMLTGKVWRRHWPTFSISVFSQQHHARLVSPIGLKGKCHECSRCPQLISVWGILLCEELESLIQPHRRNNARRKLFLSETGIYQHKCEEALYHFSCSSLIYVACTCAQLPLVVFGQTSKFAFWICAFDLWESAPTCPLQAKCETIKSNFCVMIPKKSCWDWNFDAFRLSGRASIWDSTLHFGCHG